MNKTYSTTVPNAVEKIWCGSVPYAPQQDITYTAFNKTDTVTEGNYELTYTYGPDNQRKKSVLTNTSTGNVEKTIIYTGSYEKITVSNNTYEVHYIAGGSGLTAINVRTNNGPDELFYVYTDHLGSILKLTDATGSVIYETNFDAWGRNRNPNEWTYTPPLGGPGGVPEWLIRGFTGHEHLNAFALINMNGRMYDPVIGRVLSPDNNVQFPFSTQNYNRYSYVLNNPMRYADPTGNIVFTDDLIVGFIKGFFSTGGGFKNKFNTGMKSSMRHFTNSMRIYGGLFAYDVTYSGKGDVWRDIMQVASRFTWELPQTAIGFFGAHGLNTGWDVKGVEYFRGATVVNAEEVPGTWGVTFGSYIYGGGIAYSIYETDPKTGESTSGADLLYHEYGHYKQSQSSGWLYLLKYGLPSAINQGWTELDADERSEAYFNRSYKASDFRATNPQWYEYLLFINNPFLLTLYNLNNPAP